MLTGYNYIASAPVGNAVKEIYAYFYNTKLTLGNIKYVYADTSDDFIREPYIATFSAGNFDFALVTIHVIYSDTVEERRTEVRLLDNIVGNVTSTEKDIILLGDFNLPPDDSAWQFTTHTPVVLAEQKTTISDTSSYDNIWINSTFTTEYDSLLEIYKFDEVEFANDDDTASLEVSDHRPVAVNFNTRNSDDDSGEINIITDINNSGSKANNILSI